MTFIVDLFLDISQYCFFMPPLWALAISSIFVIKPCFFLSKYFFSQDINLYKTCSSYTQQFISNNTSNIDSTAQIAL